MHRIFRHYFNNHSKNFDCVITRYHTGKVCTNCSKSTCCIYSAAGFPFWVKSVHANRWCLTWYQCNHHRVHTSTTMQRLQCYHSIQNFELDISDWFFTQGSFPSAPLKTLNNWVFDRTQKSFVYLWRQCIIHQDVWACWIRAKCPDWTSCKQIPVIFCLEELP